MKVEEQQRYLELRDYWWIAGKYQTVVDLIKSLNLRPKTRILDFGCGPGNIMDSLHEYGEIAGMDTSLEALHFCQSRGHKSLFQGTGESLSVRSGTFELIVAIETLEHITDDLKAIREIYRICTPGGFVVLTVPAFKFLWGDHDRKYGHKRRYTTKSLRSKLEEVGFSLVKISYIHSIFVMPLWLWRRWKGFLRSEKDDFIAIPGWLNRLFGIITSIEGKIIRKVNLPFGSSIICIARK